MMDEGRSHLKKEFPVTESFRHFISLPFQNSSEGVVGGSVGGFKIKLHTDIHLPRWEFETSWGCDVPSSCSAELAT